MALTGRRADRHARRKAEIVAAAWEIARRDGLAGLSLYALARRVGLRQPSLYAYFDAKNELFDEMFAHGNRELLRRLTELDPGDDPRAAVLEAAATFAAFCAEDQARYQLLFLRTVPDFEPSQEAYGLAREVIDFFRRRLAAAGVTEPEDLDIFVAVLAGVVDVQQSKQLGGDRWLRHLPRLVEMYFADLERRGRLTTSAAGQGTR